MLPKPGSSPFSWTHGVLHGAGHTVEASRRLAGFTRTPTPRQITATGGAGLWAPPRGSDSAFACPTWSQRSQTFSATKPSGRGFIDPESSRRLRALEATSEVVAGMRSRRCPGWPHGKRGHGRDTNGNLWGCPLCRWRDKRSMERG